MDKATAIKEIDSWPMEDRLDLVQQVWDRMRAAGWQPQLTEEQKAEFDRRLDALDANPGNVVSWDDIVKHVRRPR